MVLYLLWFRGGFQGVPVFLNYFQNGNTWHFPKWNKSRFLRVCWLLTFNLPNRKEVIGRNLDYSNPTKIGNGNQTFTMPFDGVVIRTAEIGKGNGVYISINNITVVTNRPYRSSDLVNGGVVFAIAQAGDTVVASADYGSTGTTVVIPYVEKAGFSMYIKY